MLEYPCLASAASGAHVPLPREDASWLIGRSPDAFLRVPAHSCSRRQLRVTRRDGVFYVEQLSERVPTRVNGRALEGEVPLTHGTRLEFAGVEFRFLEAPDSDSADVTLVDGGADDPELTVAGSDWEGGAAPIGAGHVGAGHVVALAGSGALGRGSSAVYRLEHPRVSRRHAELRVSGDQVELRDLGSANGTFVNGQRADRFVRLRPGDRVDIGPFCLVFDGRRFVQSTQQGNLLLEARGLSLSVAQGTSAERRLLDDVSLLAQPRELLAVIGPSGSGKTTLLKALSGRAAIAEGEVLVNGVSLQRHFEALKQGIAVVPQRDLLHEALRLEELLRYTARLRLPPDMEADGIRATVARTLDRVDLVSHARSVVRDMSGGQRRRASLAGEIVQEPNLLFVDEVTSGLDEEADREIMRLLSSTAERGVTVVCVTHTLANIEAFCHKVAVLASGGVLAFYGTPSECLDYFSIPHLSAVYQRLSERPAPQWKHAYEQSPYHARHLNDGARGSGPASGAVQSRPRRPLDPLRRVRELARQTRILTARANRLLVHDRHALAIAAAQSLTVGFVLAAVFAGLVDARLVDGIFELPPGAPANLVQKQTTLVFLLGVSCLWFGCSNASQEIVKERPIYLRERDTVVRVPSYLASKLTGLFALGALQACALYAVVAALVSIPGRDGPQLVMMVAAALTGTCLGLLISAATSTRDQATTLVPIVLIPQIVMSGVTVPDMPAAAESFAKFIVSGHWVVEGMRPLVSGAGLVYPAWPDILRPCGMLGAHAVAFLVAALIVLSLRDRRGLGPRAARGALPTPGARERRVRRSPPRPRRPNS